MSFLTFPPTTPPRLASLVLLTLITVSPILAGFVPPVAVERRELSSVPEGELAVQGATEPWEAELAQARRLRADGRYEDAASAYRAALSRAPNAASVALSAAEAYLAARDHRGVLDLTALALASNPAASDAYALRGEAFAGLGDPGQALSSFRSYLATEPVGGYAAFRAAEIAANAGDVNAAGDLYRRALDLGMAPWWEATAARRVGEIYRAANEPLEAVGWLERARAAAAEAERQALPAWYDGELVRRAVDAGPAPILFALGNARRDAGLVADAIDAYSDVVALYPGTADADRSLTALADLGGLAAVSASARGLVDYNARRPRQAIAAFSEFLRASTDDARLARAAYYLGLARRDAGERAAARDDLYVMARLYPDSPQAPDALVQAARIAESMGLAPEDQVRAYLAVADAYPSSSQAARSLVRGGEIALAAGDVSGARVIWDRLARSHPDASARAQAFFLLGRNSLGAGDRAAAVVHLSAAVDEAPLTYEGLRARDLRDRGLGAEPFPGVSAGTLATVPPDDAAACTDWVASWAEAASGEGTSSRALARVDRLQLIGLRAAAQAEALQATRNASPRDLHALARGLAERQLYAQSMFAALRLGSASPAGSADAAPPCLQRLVYPLGYTHLVQQEADRRGLSPYLLLSLLRQESWFSTHALSSADARGLSQVLPSTGAGIARALGRSTFDAEDLYRPSESVTFGAWYLAEQIRNLGSRPLLALAAYNGGGGNALRWSGRNMRIDADDFVDAIDYSETRGYVRSIYQMYSRYQQLYG